MITKYRLVKYESESQEQLDNEIAHSIPVDSPIEYQKGLLITTKDIDPTTVAQFESYVRLRAALLLLLDNVDYVAGNCRPNEMIGAILPSLILERIKKELG